MGAAPAISAGVSLIGGVANISAKNKAARAQREAIAAESYQRAAQQMANEQTLVAQQQLAQQNYNNSVLARLSQFHQAEAGLQAQEMNARLQAQQQAFAIQSGQLQQALQAGQQSEALQRQAAGVQIDANAKRQQSDAQLGAVAEAVTNNADQVAAALTAEERKRLSLEASGRLSTSSNETARSRELTKRIAASLSAGLNMDRDLLAKELEAMNEDDLILAGERLGLLDNANAAESVAANLRLMGISADAGLEATDRNLELQRSAIDIARQQQLMSGQLDLNNMQNSYVTQDQSLGMQRSLNKIGGDAANKSLANAYANTKGAGLMDWLNVGVNTYGAISPMLNRGSSVPTPSSTQRYLTGANGFSNGSGITDTESMLAQQRAAQMQPAFSEGFTGDTVKLNIMGGAR